MTWSWQEPYQAALGEKDPRRLQSKLTAAEKAIFHRLRELPAGAAQLPEAEALRAALDRLYALFPKEHYAPGQIEDEDAAMRRNWLRLAVPLGLGVTLAFAIAIAMARRSEREYAPGMAAAKQAQVAKDSRSDIVPRNLPAAGVGTDKSANATRAAGSSGGDTIRQAAVEHSALNARPDVRSGPTNGEDAQRKSTNVVPEAVVHAQPNAAAVRDLSRIQDSGGQAPAQSSAIAATRGPVSNSAEGGGSNSVVQVPKEDEDSRPGNEAAVNSGFAEGSVTVSASAYPSIRVPAELKQQASASGESFQIGEPIVRVDPIYPEEAEQQHIAGTVKLRAVVGKDGIVENVEAISGPSLLTPSAIAAIRQWRYKPTLLGEQPVEIAEEITIVFKLPNTTASANRP